ncbi:septin CDC3 KNAG_0J02790 [Huiozyma naganishii CBS 8797]|uniref:Septin-type G domain-containing protein n=1 Tax=Huiozyma naganishii (strain ATCC MYA-139 / BCRC 22969 / CBS 8797 / KCTC 17520 / NBRC 10181 / NCYC 3082 / Yp74L-3) TaxID=1071383 RepID=J7RR81_HUIN7|nr:hypothetical protein KNAG_0J02790 [Kazachstania naganishii CBS 8797]CCK72358.1 hypothetical protein KNAG_0J02790 [Kazachstania naganishii CBS 8797]
MNLSEESQNTNGVSVKKEEMPFPPNGAAQSAHGTPDLGARGNSIGAEDPAVSVKAEQFSEIEQNKLDLQSISNELNQFDSAQEAGQVLPPQPASLKIVNRQITGYVGFANLPKQWHRKSVRRGFNLNVLCVGRTGLGKTTLINSLFNENFSDTGVRSGETPDGNDQSLDEDTLGDKNSQVGGAVSMRNTVKIETQSKTIEENGVKLKLTLIDAAGFGDAIDNTDSWKPVLSEINSRFDHYLDQENRINRTKIEDNRVHVCLYFIEPTGHYLKPLDLEFCSQVHDKCNLIPVISKSDILSDEEIELFKSRISNQLREHGVTLFRPPVYKMDDNETIQTSKTLYEKMPYAVVGSNSFVKDPNNPELMVRGREYPWGIIEVENSNHSDFNLLRDLLIKQYLEELRERTAHELYENYRSKKLISLGIKQDNSVFKEFDPNTRQEEEKRLHEAKLAKLESEMKTVFQQKVTEKEKKLQKSETELFARHKEMKDKLTKQLKALEEKKHQLELSLANPSTSSPVPQKKKGFLR